MRYLCYTETELDHYPICLLVPEIRKEEINATYFQGTEISPEDVLVMDLHKALGKKKTPVKEIKQYIEEELVPVFEDMGIRYVLCAQGEYFKALTKLPKIEPNMGYVLDSPYGNFKVVYVPNYKATFYDPEKIKTQVAQGINALISHAKGEYKEPGADIVHFKEFPKTYDEIKAWLGKLLELNVPLAIDIEAFSLKHNTAGIGSITFCWSQHEGIAFLVDYEPMEVNDAGHHGRQVRNEPVRELLRNFFRSYSSRALYHNISYDAYILIYQLFMDDILDTKGLLDGLDIMLRNWDCTKLITYLATNTCAGNDLKLKTQAQEFSGNWAQDDIKDIRKIPQQDLLNYNLIDGLSTWFTYTKHHPTMIADEQKDIYETIFKPSIPDIIQMQLTGLPLNMTRVVEVKALLQAVETSALDIIHQSCVIEEFTHLLAQKWADKRNSELKVKRVTPADYPEQFNPNSGPQLQMLFFEFLDLPVLSLTDTKQPSTDNDTIQDLQNHVSNQQILDLLKAILDFKSVAKILTSFIPAFENAAKGPDGWHYLSGNFNLGGTLSGRLSSSDPNLQNLPSNIFMVLSKAMLKLYADSFSEYIKKGKLNLGKLIKSCFQAPPGWLFVGLDFDSLEDKISALTTKDPNKLKVYTDGYDGHCLRAFAYYGESMPGIADTVPSINSIEDKYPDLRQDSKVPTFALTYKGTFNTLMRKCGFSREKAQLIESRYHELYKVSDAWIDAHLAEASKTGYITAAFGLRVRTPLLKQVVLGTSKTPYEAEAEGRSAGNAMGQSWCLLNNRASSEFMNQVRSSEFRLDIRPCAQIHDAQYMIIRDTMTAVQYVNVHLVKAVRWQSHPDIYHPQVKLGGKLSVFYPSWSKEIEIPNNASTQDIQEIVSAIE